MPYQIVALPGDGIGPEVLEQGLKVLDVVRSCLEIEWNIRSIPCGGRYYLEHAQRDWPEGSEQACQAADLILLGAVGWPASDGLGPVTMSDGKMAGYSAVLGNRSRLDLYANVRPVRLFPGVRHPLHGEKRLIWKPELVDLVFVRENTEGLYSGMGGILSPGGRAEVATDTRVITRRGSERVLRHAFELCRKRNGKKRLTCIVKDNVLYGCKLFQAVCREVAATYPEIELEFCLVDSFAMLLLTQPEHYDVCVTTNLFGDILTDIAAVLQGGMGLAVGCNLGEAHGMFEPIHGSAPALAGKDQANPMAMILAVGSGLAWLGERKPDSRLLKGAAAIEQAVRNLLEAGEPLSFDLAAEGKAAPCSVVGEALACETARVLKQSFDSDHERKP